MVHKNKAIMIVSVSIIVVSLLGIGMNSYYKNMINNLISNFSETYDTQEKIIDNYRTGLIEISSCISRGNECDMENMSKKLDAKMTEKEKLDKQLTNLNNETTMILKNYKITKQCKSSKDCREGLCVSFEKLNFGQTATGTCANFVPIRACYSTIENSLVTNTLCSD